MFMKFLRDRRGSVLPTFAIAAIPLVVVTGGVVDYSRAFDQRTVVQDAMDAAALAAGKKLGIWTDTQVKTEANTFYTTNLGNKIEIVPTLTSAISAATLTLTTQLHVKTYFLGMIGLNEFVFNLSAQSTQAMGTLEVAMVLDNSTSMNLPSSKMSTLKTAAASLATTLWNLGATSTKPNPVEIAVVPFGASVNIGTSWATDSTATWLDKTGASPESGEAMESYGATGVSNLTLFNGLNTSWAGCIEERPQPYDATDDAGTTATPATLYEPMFAPDEPDNWTCDTGSCSYAGSSTSTRRFNGAPTGSQDFNNYLPDDGDPSSCAASYKTISAVNTSTDVITTSAAHGLTAGTQISFHGGTLPGGLSANTVYYVKSAGLTSTAFEVSTTSGTSGTAVNLSSAGSGTRYVDLSANFTCQSGSANCGGTNIGKKEQDAFAGKNLSSALMCKYGTSANKVTPASITVANLTGTGGGGPNFMCTTPAVTPLTTTASTITSAINVMQPNGYTNITAGLMWGWRVLSPGAPFTQGRSYTTSDNQKIIVLMTDGENTYSPYLASDQNPASSTWAGKFLKSAYGSWDYLVMNNLGSTATPALSSDVFTKLNARTAEACTNAKAAGIRIYTVGFEINSQTSDDPATALALLQNCATDINKYFDAQNESDLTNAFTAIGNDISLLRLSQ